MEANSARNTQNSNAVIPEKQKELDKKNLKLFVCDIFGCEAAFKTKFSLKRHYKKHYTKKSLACRYCPKHFNLPQYLEEHEHTHTGQKPYACPHCPMKFRQRGKLSHHKRAMHSDKVHAGVTEAEMEEQLIEMQNH